MSTFLLMITVLLPLALVAIWPAQQCRAWVGRLSAWAAFPAILLAVLANEVSVELPWLLFGSRWGLDETGRVFLAFTATLWFGAGIFARSYLAADPSRDRFELFYLLTMAGNLGVTLSQDMVSFLLFFTLMSLAAYGLITHNREPESFRAGRTYIILAVFSEILLFWAVVLAVQQTGTVYFEGFAARLGESPLRNVITGMLLIGFGVKLGVMPLHFWLPLAHPAAPTPASAVLSGAIIKTGLLGLLRFLPLGAVALPEWGALCIVMGVATALLAVFIGLTQDNPKTVLAYSSVSQMGLVSVGIGSGLLTPDAWKLTSAALLLYAAHHAIAKAALFLGVGVAQVEFRSRWQQTLITSGLVVAGLSLAGLPWTSGFAAKIGLKYAAAATAEPWSAVLSWILPTTGFTTTLLVSRFLWLVWPRRQHSHHALTPGMVIPWSILSVGVVVFWLALRFGDYVKPTWVELSRDKLWAATGPMLAASIVVLLVGLLPTCRAVLQAVRVPAGDLVVPLNAGIAACRRVRPVARVWEESALSDQFDRMRITVMRVAVNALDYLTRVLETDLSAGFLVGILAVVVFILTIL